jgi:Lysyl oxidase/S-layer homology domain
VTRTDTHRTVRLVGLALGLAAILVGVLPVQPAEAASDRLPDLKAANIRDFHIVKHGSRRLLRFTGIMWNSGDGPLEIRSKRTKVGAAWDVDQIIYDSAGGHRRVQTTATLKYAGDGHDHWHVRRMLSYHLWGAHGTLRDAKIGFCFFDTNLIDGGLKRSPSHAVYRESTCGHRSSLSTRNGISVGWADRYAWNFAFQYIDITGLPGGTYSIRAAVDLYGQFTEKSDTNNCTWARIKFNTTGKSVKLVAQGKSCINDYATSPFADDIAWAREAGISNGCDVDMFCTNNPMTRGQTATFVARAFHYPAATQDYFTDDEDSAHEANINRIAEAGLTSGCAAGKYCPNKRVTRAQVASFLARALDLPDATEDFFDDDDGTTFEADINRLAQAGIASGCGERLFCPTKEVSRGQLVVLLHRSLEDPAP